jgi:hypothetical protein
MGQGMIDPPLEFPGESPESSCYFQTGILQSIFFALGPTGAEHLQTGKTHSRIQ